MDTKISEMEVLLDKLNILFNAVKKDGSIDRYEGELMRKYLQQLQDALRMDTHTYFEKEVPPAIVEVPEIVIPTKLKEEVPEKNPDPIEVKKMIEPIREQDDIFISLKEPLEKLPEVKPQPVEPVKNQKKQLVKEMEDEEKEENYTSGLHNKLKLDKRTLADKISTNKAKDLKKVIHLNERLFLVKELFNGNSSIYDQEINTINGMSNFTDVKNYIEIELSAKFKWTNRESIDRFLEVLEVKFE